jgi:hypothetical protein
MTSLEDSVRLPRKLLAKVLHYKGFDGSRSGARGGSGRNLGRKSGLRRICGDRWWLMPGSAAITGGRSSFEGISEAAARTGADRLRTRIEELTGELARAEGRVSRLAITPSTTKERDEA